MCWLGLGLGLGVGLARSLERGSVAWHGDDGLDDGGCTCAAGAISLCWTRVGHEEEPFDGAVLGREDGLSSAI